MIFSDRKIVRYDEVRQGNFSYNKKRQREIPVTSRLLILIVVFHNFYIFTSLSTVTIGYFLI